MAKSPRIKTSVTFNGDVIRELREARDLSQEQLADRIGTGKANVSKWERARSYVAISYDLFLELAKALYIAPEELARRLSAPPQVAMESLATRPGRRP